MSPKGEKLGTCSLKDIREPLAKPPKVGLELDVGKSGFVSHTKYTAKTTNMDLFHS